MNRTEFRPTPARQGAFFVALLATAIALGGALAHLFELPNKIGLTAEAYFAVQQIYRGWSLLGFVLLAQLVGIVAVLVTARHERRVFAFALAALLCLVAAQALFWAFTFPANQATQNWTMVPENWATLRVQWEYSHAAGAAFQLGAMTCLILAVLSQTGTAAARA